MKKFFVFGMVGAIALTFAACSQSNEVNPVQAGLDGESVHTQFSISFPKTKATRMTAKDAQEDEVFSGMTDMKLYPFAEAAASAESSLNFDVISLGSLANAAAFTESGANHMSKVYDVAVPLGVKSFLFYGKKTTTQDGELTATFPEKGAAVTGINFALVPIQEKAITAMAQDADGANVLAALNAVEAALADDATFDGLRIAFETNTAGAAVSVAALLADLSESLGKIAGTAATNAKTAVDAQISALNGNTFPRTIGLPDGAVSVKFTGGAASTTGEATPGTFSFALNDNKGLGSPALETYTKPAELYYYANTPINVSTTTHKDQYTSKSTWAEVLAMYETANGTVTNTTAAIALVKPINYAVAQMQSSVKLAEGVEQFYTGKNDSIAEPNFEVNGVLVLSQKDLDWKFQPVDEDASYVVYDAKQTGSTVAVSTTPTSTNYTLLPESDATELQVAVELTNKGDDFFGYEGQLIPKGTRFYLVGKLTKPEGATTQIFQQDYKTIVNFTIGENSLKNAYNTVPDLRTPQLELGLTVDLKWQEGLTFDVTFE